MNESELTINLNDGTHSQISIIVMHHNRPAYLNMCVQSIDCMSNLNNFELIVVDNASGQETQDYLNVLEQEGVKVVRNNKNLMWSAAANLGVAAADKNSHYYVFMHCDTVVLTQSWLDVLVNGSESRSSGLVGCDLESYILQKQQIRFVPEWCMLMTKQCWNDVGPWPEELPLVGNAFIMSHKANKLGYKPFSIKNNLVHHYRAISYNPNELNSYNEKAKVIIPRLIEQIG